jgi:hypothetical protein
MNVVKFKKNPGAVKGYFHVSWFIDKENALHQFDLGTIESPAMRDDEIADNNDFFTNQGYTIERVK